MGIQKREGSGKAVFFDINSKEGCFSQWDGHNRTKHAPGSADLEGLVIGMAVDPKEVNGAKSERLRLVLADPTPGEPNMHVSFTISTEASGVSSFGLKLLGAINAADITKPVKLFPWFMNAGTKLGETTAERDTAGCTVYQDGQKIKPDFNGDTRLPELPKVKVGNKEHLDKTPWDTLLDQQLELLAGRITPSPAEGAHPEGDDVDLSEAATAAEAAAAAAPAQAAANRAGFRQRAGA